MLNFLMNPQCNATDSVGGFIPSPFPRRLGVSAVDYTGVDRRERIHLAVYRLVFLSSAVFAFLSLQALASAATDKRAVLLSVRIVPETVTLWGVEGAQRVVVLGKYSDGLERDVTALSHFVVADSG